jgi:hypothetical protein
MNKGTQEGPGSCPEAGRGGPARASHMGVILARDGHQVPRTGLRLELRACGASQKPSRTHDLLPVLRWHGATEKTRRGRRPRLPVSGRYQSGVSPRWAGRRWGLPPARNRRPSCIESKRSPGSPSWWTARKLRTAGIRRVSEGPGRRPNDRGADPSTPFVTWCFPSLRGLDLNQRPLGYESCISRSAQAYPLLTGHVRCPEITSDHLSQPQFSHKNPAGAPLPGSPSRHDAGRFEPYLHPHSWSDVSLLVPPGARRARGSPANEAPSRD